MQRVGKLADKGSSTSKFILYFASCIYFMTWCIAVYTWLVDGSFPDELVRYSGAFFGIAFGTYCCKSAYEHKTDRECEALFF